jgi:VWFA-related protein
MRFRNSLMILGLSVLLGAVGTAVAPAQEAPEAETPFAGEIEVTEALVDILVTDRDGNVILGLRPSDFEVTEQGRPLEVTGATFYSNRRFLDAAGAEKLGIDPAAVPDQRLFILLFDDQSRHSASDPTLLLSRQLKAGRDVAAWLRGGLQSGDLVAVLSYDGRLRLQQDFTADRAQIERAVERAVRSADEPKDWPSRAGESAQSLPALAATLPQGDALREATPSMELALTALADATAPIGGRKNLLLFSSGFGDLTLAEAPERKRLEPMTQALNAANIAVYAADLAPPSTVHERASVISDLATETGGRPFFELTNFELPLERVAATTNGYYLVSFKSEHPADASGYRPIEVKVSNPEFRVTARKGYKIGS